MARPRRPPRSKMVNFRLDRRIVFVRETFPQRAVCFVAPTFRFLLKSASCSARVRDRPRLREKEGQKEKEKERENVTRASADRRENEDGPRERTTDGPSGTESFF